MTEDIKIQEPLSRGLRFYYGLLAAVFVVSNTISLILLLNSLFTGSEVKRLFYWIGVALLSIFTYPLFQRAKHKNKHLMVVVSIVVLILVISIVILLQKL
jgi:hypothetical protein